MAQLREDRRFALILGVRRAEARAQHGHNGQDPHFHRLLLRGAARASAREIESALRG
jgi:hypothetical protein